MSVEEVTEVCRLCLKNETLVWIFNTQSEIPVNMKDVIFITTGVKIQQDDLVTQKICRKCMQISKKIYQFRETSLRNDNLLKDKYKKLIGDGGVKIPNTSVTVKTEGSSQQPDTKPVTNCLNIIHPSVKKVFNKFPDIKLPNSCLNMNISPCIAMPMNEVENYFKQQNSSIQKHCLYVFQALRSDKKRSDTSQKINEVKETVENGPSTSTIQNKEVSPINIKLMNPQKTQYKIVKKYAESRLNGVKSDLKRKFPSRDSTPEPPCPSTSKKRKTSESSNNSEKEEDKSNDGLEQRISLNKPTLIESLGLTPSTKVDSPVQVSYVEKTLEICNICNSVQNSVKDLKRHQLKHLRCQFCKTKFKSMELKQEHIEERCIIKKTMNSLPDVNLTKIEYNLSIRQKYPDAFTSFPPIKGLVVESNQSDEKINHPESENKNTLTKHITADNKGDGDANDIIEILSDDEEQSGPKPTSPSVEAGAQTSGISIKPSSKSAFAPASQMGVTVPSTSIPEQPPSLQNTNIPANLSSSVVKPDIRIRNNYILDTIDPKATDMMVLQELLKNYSKIQLTKDTASQPELPTNTSVKTNLNDMTTTLQGLKHQLNIFRIPVEVKHGPYKVSFDYNPKKKKFRKMSVWNHLTAIDLKISAINEAKMINNSSSANHQNVVTTSKNQAQIQSGCRNNPVSNKISLDTVTQNNSASRIQSCSSYQQILPSTNPTQISSGFNSGVPNVPSQSLPREIHNSSLNQQILLSNSSTRTQINTGYNNIGVSNGSIQNVLTQTNTSNQQILISTFPSGTAINSGYNNSSLVSNVISQDEVSKNISSSSHYQNIKPKPNKRVQVQLGYKNIQVAKKSAEDVLKQNNSTSANHLPVISGSNSTIVSNMSTQNIPTNQPPPYNANIPTSQPLPYNAAVHLNPISNSMSTFSNQNGMVQASPPVSLQNAVSISFPTNVIDNNKATTSTASNSVGIAYHPNNTVLVPQSTTLSSQAQLLFQTNGSSPMFVNPNSYLSYNSASTVYNTNTSVMIPNNVPQVLVPSAPVLSSSPLVTSNPVSTVLSTNSNILPTPAVSSSSTSGLSFSNNNPSTCANSPVPGPSTSTISVLSTNSTHSNIVNFNNNLEVRNPLLASYLCTESQASSSSTHNSKTMPLIRVKNLLELK